MHKNLKREATRPPAANQRQQQKRRDAFQTRYNEIRKISTFGAFRLHSKQIFLSNALVHDCIRLEEIEEGIWNIVYNNTVLGRLIRKTGKISGHDKV